MSNYLDLLESLAVNLGIKIFSRDEAKDWIESFYDSNSLPSIESISRQWRESDPCEYGDPFGILTFWADQRQAKWDSQNCTSPIFPKSPDYSMGYSLLMGNIK